MFPTTPEFFCFVVLVFVLRWAAWGRSSLTVWLVCAANLFFLAKWGFIYVALLPAASLTDFGIGHMLGKQIRPSARKLLVVLSILVNIGLIVTARYVPFFTGIQWALPLGLSFYAFQALTYTIDIYRGHAKPAGSYFTYLASVTFFPTVIAGPITNAAELIKQWTARKEPLTSEESGRAFFLIGMGLAKKFLLADYLATNLIDRVFDLPALYSGGDVLVAVYGYAFQLYYDFSGYTDIAIGTALLLGIKLPPNFNAPYLAANISDFWRRWHITLSNWLRDYVFFSLPGKRSKWLPYLNLVITMAIGGLWHGPNWTFLLWGLLHGVAQAVFRGWQAVRGKRPATIPGVFLTFHFVVFAWIFFRAGSVDTAVLVLKQLGTFPYAFSNTTGAFLFVLGIAVLGHAIPRSWYGRTLNVFSRAPALAQAGALAALILAIEYVGATGAAPFIYSKF